MVASVARDEVLVVSTQSLMSGVGGEREHGAVHDQERVVARGRRVEDGRHGGQRGQGHAHGGLRREDAAAGGQEVVAQAEDAVHDVEVRETHLARVAIVSQPEPHQSYWEACTLPTEPRPTDAPIVQDVEVRSSTNVGMTPIMLSALLAFPGSGQAPDLAAPAQPGTHSRLASRVDPRIELISILFRLVGAPEYNQARLLPYASLVDEVFGHFRSHPVVEMARDLRTSRGVGLDACMSFALHLDPAFPERVGLVSSRQALDSRWPRDLDAFVEALEDFVQASDFSTFYDEHAAFYAECRRRLDAVLAEAEMAWFDRFFGSAPPASFELAIGLLNGGANYGPRVQHQDGSVSFHCVLGAWKEDDEGRPLFDSSFVPTIVHEFNHSYCNPLIDAHAEELETPLFRLWPSVADRMREQAYGDWRTMAYESLVRACVTRYIADTRGEEAGVAHAHREIDRGFLWTAELANVLGEYAEQRDRYPDLAAFFPLVIDFFEQYEVPSSDRGTHR